MAVLECRHDFQCEGWTVDPATSTCRACGKQLVFWSEHQQEASWSWDVPGWFAYPPAPDFHWEVIRNGRH